MEYAYLDYKFSPEIMRRLHELDTNFRRNPENWKIMSDAWKERENTLHKIGEEYQVALKAAHASFPTPLTDGRINLSTDPVWLAAFVARQEMLKPADAKSWADALAAERKYNADVAMFEQKLEAEKALFLQSSANAA